jgi:hypothetical protein
MPEIIDNPIPPRSSTPTGERSSANESGAAAAASKAGDEAVALKDEAVGAAADVKQRATAEVKSVAGEARHEARYVLGEVRTQLSGQADDAARRLASAMTSAAAELRSMAEHSDNPDGPVTAVVRQVADRSADLGQRLESGGYQGVAEDVARFGRNKAGLFLVAAGAAGFAVGRLLRNTDTGAVVQAAKDEVHPNGGTGTSTSVGAGTAVTPDALPGPPDRPPVVATPGTYAPTGARTGGL